MVKVTEGRPWPAATLRDSPPGAALGVGQAFGPLGQGTGTQHLLAVLQQQLGFLCVLLLPQLLPVGRHRFLVLLQAARLPAVPAAAAGVVHQLCVRQGWFASFTASPTRGYEIWPRSKLGCHGVVLRRINNAPRIEQWWQHRGRGLGRGRGRGRDVDIADERGQGGAAQGLGRVCWSTMLGNVTTTTALTMSKRLIVAQ